MSETSDHLKNAEQIRDADIDSETWNQANAKVDAINLVNNGLICLWSLYCCLK